MTLRQLFFIFSGTIEIEIDVFWDYSILTDDLWFQNFAVLNFPFTFFTNVEPPN